MLAARRADQVAAEVGGVLRMVGEVYGVFGLTYKLALSTRPATYLGSLEVWDRAEASLTQALDATGLPWEVRAQRSPPPARARPEAAAAAGEALGATRAP
jgi:threonyl-tRNA synthetase